MATPHDVSTQKLIDMLAGDLAGKVKQPAWSMFVKTGPQATRLPSQKDWYFKRTASILRRVYVDGPVGIERLRTVYGGLAERGAKPKRFARAGGKIIRTILQDLEKEGLVEKAGKDGRAISAKGRKYVDGLCRKVSEYAEKENG
ncbi:MAG: 30S ribosomal protein S19e [archaeon]